MSDGRRRGRRRHGALAAVLFMAAALPWLAGCGRDQTAIDRGDRAWADSNFTEALAEYRLALARHADAATRLRTAHAFAHTGDLPHARDEYRQLLATDSAAAPQAAYDFLVLARKGLAKKDPHTVATAVDAALAAEPRLELGDMAPMLARYYVGTGDTRRAIQLYQRSLVAGPADSVPRYLYQIGRLYQSLGRCDTALAYLTAFRPGGPESRTRLEAGAEEIAEAKKSPGAEAQQTLLGEAHWALGSCAFEVAKQEHLAGNLPAALEHLELTTRLREPRNIQDQAWFERGEVLFALNRKQEALAAYYKVLELDPAGQGQLVQRARQRIDEIRFGGG